MKLTYLLKPIIGGIFALCSLSSFAATGWCTADSGTYPYNVTFDKAYNDPLQNAIGTTYKRTYQWDLGGTFKGGCDCTYATRVAFIKASVPGLSFSRTVDGLNFYTLNKYLEVATEAYVSGNYAKYAATPFDNINNGAGDTCGQSTRLTFATGSKGYVSLYIASPFVGQVVIPQTKILDIFASKESNSFGNIPISSVYISGSVTVPQSCDINAGQVINVDFEGINAGNIKTKGENASGFTPKVVNMTLACNNISEGVKIKLSISGEASSGDPTALATSNNDIGVRILNAAGEPVSPNEGGLPVNMDYAAQTGTSSMSLAPMNVTGNVPSSGEFNATATIRAEMQ
jgi:type 1 fimbria pilin